MSNLRGLERVIHNLNKEIKAIEGRSMKGLIRAAIIIRRDMDITPPVIPVDTSNMRGSWFTTPGYQGNGNPFLTMGFSANYSAYVHEMIGAKFQRPGAGPKFFQAAFRRNKEDILEVIREEAQIKG
ncbi:MAG: hypothetical protein D4R73_05945 [Deltaproteobacteria bacterium]|nr:MAG: hypothetical protein D4R73_05945 [Deltaproteobacteria bacterium]